MIRPAILIKVSLALTIALAIASPARAQGLLGMWLDPPDKLVCEALDTAYARAILKTFAASVRRDGDPACLDAKALDDAALVAGGRVLLQRYGVQTMKIVDENIDRAAYQSALSASAGPNAAAEFERLKRDPGVKALIAFDRPARLAKAVDTILEQFDRYVLIARIKLDPISPIARGEAARQDNPSEAMRANPTPAAEAAVQRFLERHPSPRIARYLDLLAAAEPVGARSAAKLGPMVYFAGAERGLAALCVGHR
jgi:hypothetical protein